ncbi:MAG TPA: hypothetical protein VEB67_03090, partial [Nitrososphaerales archaeon]|nr:hypothetical protein [Nitrososphaerales archaeon]
GAVGLLALAASGYVLSSKQSSGGEGRSLTQGGGQTLSTSEPTFAKGAQDPIPPSPVNVRVAYFGMPPSVTGVKKETLGLMSPAVLSDLKAELTVLHPKIAPMLSSMLFLVDGVSATGNPELPDDVEVDVLATFAGG